MDGILKISEATSLGIHSMAFLAAQESGKPFSTKEIAKVLGVSENHLSKVVQRLVKAGIAESTRGPRGGVQLAKDSKDTSLLNIYEAIEGKLEVTECLLSTRLCEQGNCIFGNLLTSLTSETIKYLETTFLSDLQHVFAGAAPEAKPEQQDSPSPDGPSAETR